MNDLDRLRVEVRALMASCEYAFAMGHGCSVGDPRSIGRCARGGAPAREDRRAHAERV
jgi:hypothetical protein